MRQGTALGAAFVSLKKSPVRRQGLRIIFIGRGVARRHETSLENSVPKCGRPCLSGDLEARSAGMSEAARLTPMFSLNKGPCDALCQPSLGDPV